MTDLVEGHMYSKDKFIDVENDTDNIDDFIDETPYDKLFTSATIAQHGSEEAPSSSSQYKKIDEIIQRVDDVEMKELMKKWIYKYTNVFDDELNDKPARVKPFELHEKPNSTWNKSATNKGQPRWQMISKQKEVEHFIMKALEAKLIQPSSATAWSQVHLQPKPNNKWRFCIDFRNLNEQTDSQGWPIPNIKQVLQRISKSKAKYFAVLDLTQGYYQMLIHENSRHLTAFRTALGIFEWLRLPMGLKGAGSYYQSQMQNVVLSDLLYRICESYLDDILVYGKTKKE